jgi:hypothetical protein
VDNLYFWGGGPATVPNSAAPTPTLPAAYVKSLFNSGGTYVDYNASGTPAGLGNWNPNWGQGGSISDTVVGGRTIKLMNLVNYQGVDISGPNGDPGETHPGPIDATGMSFLHISYWTANGTTLSVDLINNAAETFTMPSASSSQVTFAVTQGAWAELNIPLPAGFTDLTTIRQIKFTNQTDAIHNGAFGPAGVFYLDNLYFWTPPPTAPTTAAPSPGLPSGSVQSLYNSSATYVDYNSGAGGLGNWNPNWGQGGSISDVVVGGKTVKLMNLVNYQGVDISGPNGDPGESAPAAINISGKTSLHISYWTANGTALAVDIISHVSESWATATVGQRSFTVTQFAWVDLEVPIPAGMTDLTQIRQLKFATEANAGTGSGGGGVFYLDNLYFH